MKGWLKGLFDHARFHHKTREMPAWVRRRMYRELLAVVDEERHAAEIMGLKVQPRLCLVDETRVAILRPGDRAQLKLDEQLAQVRETGKASRED